MESPNTSVAAAPPPADDAAAGRHAADAGSELSAHGSERGHLDEGFCHLHLHTEFSVLDGMGRVTEAVAAVKAAGQTAAAITDHGTKGGVFQFVTACRREGIKPIVGNEVYLAIGSRHDPQVIEVPRDGDVDGGEDTAAGSKRKFYEHLTVLARNLTGYRNLVKLDNKSQDTVVKAVFGKEYPLVDFDLLAEHGDGLILLTGCLGGPVAGPLSRGDVDLARANLQRLIDAVGRDHVFIEIMDHGIDAEHKALAGLKQLAHEFSLPMVATNDAHFVHEHHEQPHEAWLALQSGKTLADERRFKFNGDGYWLRSEAEMRAVRPDSAAWQQAVSNTTLVADQVEEYELPRAVRSLPRFRLPEGFGDSETYLDHQVMDGARARWGELTQEILERLRFEQKVITESGFADYLLVVAELIDWARSDRGAVTAEHPHGVPAAKKPIRVGPGRGSAAGSAVAYALRITEVDPLAYGLLFERFLEIGRVGMPDIDIDFEQDRVGEVAQHARELYGVDCVARIGTFGLSRTRASLKSAARVLGRPAVGTRLAGLVPMRQAKPVPIAEILAPANEAGRDFREAAGSLGGPAEEVIAFASAFEDAVQNRGIHACGVVISADPLTDMIPLRREPATKHDERSPHERGWVTEWAADDIEGSALLKMDFLYLRSLDVIQSTCDLIAADRGPGGDPVEIPDPDDHDAVGVGATYQLCGAGRTDGVFQMESSGMRDLLSQVRPQNLEDLSASSALYRPGPMAAGSHLEYANRKHGRTPVSYEAWTSDPAEADWLSKVLGNTFGLMVYQEQIMELARIVAGFNAAERSRIRKAVGKKKPDEMAWAGTQLLSRAGVVYTDPDTGEVTSPAFSRGTAERLWRDIQGCADYLFNKSHAISYGTVSFQTAWLKANYPAQFGAATLVQTESETKREAVLSTLARDGITVLGPDLNTGPLETAVVGPTTIQLGMSEISDVGQVARDIITERHTNGPFTSAAQVLERVRTDHGKSTLSSVPVQALIEAGACDGFGARLGQLMTLRTPQVPPLDAEWGFLDRALRQRRRLGVGLGEHPVHRHRDQLAAWEIPAEVVDEFGESVGYVPAQLSAEVVRSRTSGSTARLCGLLVSCTERPYSRGRMASMVIEGADGTRLEGVLWDDELRAMKRLHGALPPVGSLVAWTGRLRQRVIITDETGDPDSAGLDEPEIRLDMMVSSLCTAEFPTDGHLHLRPAPAAVDWAAVDRAAAIAWQSANRPADFTNPPAEHRIELRPTIRSGPAPGSGTSRLDVEQQETAPTPDPAPPDATIPETSTPPAPVVSPPTAVHGDDPKPSMGTVTRIGAGKASAPIPPRTRVAWIKPGRGVGAKLIDDRTEVAFGLAAKPVEEEALTEACSSILLREGYILRGPMGGHTVYVVAADRGIVEDRLGTPEQIVLLERAVSWCPVDACTGASAGLHLRGRPEWLVAVAASGTPVSVLDVTCPPQRRTATG